MLKLISAVLLSLTAAIAADVSGTWAFTVRTNQGSGTPTVNFQQEGQKLTGTFHSQIFGEVKLNGTVTVNAIEFGFVGEAGGQKIKVTYKGTVESALAMKGTAVYAGIDDKVTWAAIRK